MEREEKAAQELKERLSEGTNIHLTALQARLAREEAARRALMYMGEDIKTSEELRAAWEALREIQEKIKEEPSDTKP